MFNIDPIIESPQKLYVDDLWTKKECYGFYTRTRQEYCNFMDILDLWLVAPYCYECGQNDPFMYKNEPEIEPSTWEVDLLYEIGPNSLENTHEELRKDSEFSYSCKKCHCELRPWKGDRLYVVTYHLEEHYKIPMELMDRKRPNKSVREKIIKLYGNNCFACNAHNTHLHIDHIIPQCHGGTAAFRNLQPLCHDCGNKKGNKLPNEKQLFSNIYFGSYPEDGFVGLFW